MSINEQLIQDRTMDYATSQMEIDKAIAQTQRPDKSADQDSIHLSIMKIVGFLKRLALIFTIK